MTGPSIPRNETTLLVPADQYRFKIWAMAHGINNPDDPQHFYDYRGAFKANVEPQISPVDNQLHWPDTFKQHGHPTFSRESKYSSGPGDGGTWHGEDFTPPTPGDSASMLRKLMARRKP